MSELTLVERVLTESVLDTGHLPLSDTERTRLGLGLRSVDVAVRTGPDEQFSVAWAPARGELGGPDLRDRLRECAAAGTPVRLVRHDGALALCIGEIDARDTARRAWWTRALAGWSDAEPTPPARPRAAGGPEAYDWLDGVGFLEAANRHASAAAAAGAWDCDAVVELRKHGERLATAGGFDVLRARDVAAHASPVHEALAHAALARMDGRAILEGDPNQTAAVAGLVLKELSVRGLARRVLVICPGTLREHWRRELSERFGESFDLDPAADRTILSHSAAARHADTLGPFDLAIVDAAHRLSDSPGPARLVAAARRALLLTPTPVHRDLLDLHLLVELLRPGTFPGPRAFTDRFVDRAEPRRPINVTELSALAATALLRIPAPAVPEQTSRAAARTVAVQLPAAERALYARVLELIRGELVRPADARVRRHLAARLTAAPATLARTASRMAAAQDRASVRAALRDIAHQAETLGAGARLCAAVGEVRPGTVVFAAHADDADALATELAGAGIAAAVAHAGTPREARAAAVAAFRAGTVAALVLTDGVGVELPEAAALLHLDLPWDPMRLEQRLARLSGSPLAVATLVASGTFEEALAEVLHAGPLAATVAAGATAALLAELPDAGASVAERIGAAVCAGTDESMLVAFSELAAQLNAARELSYPDDTDRLAWWPPAGRLEPMAEGAAARPRQDDVEAFVRQFLVLAGAEIVAEDEQYLAALLPAGLATALEVQGELALAFGPAALAAHPRAELCVGGSEIFDALLAAVRGYGDLTGSARVLPVVGNAPIGAHAPWVRLRSRSVRPAAGWSARATYRFARAGADGRDHLATIEVGELPEPGQFDRYRLPAGASAPVDLDVVVAELQKVAGPELAARAAALGGTGEPSGRQALAVGNLTEQIAELDATEESEERAAERARLDAALAAARRSLAGPEDAEVRAQLLTLELHGSADLEVVEQWEHASGRRFDLVLPWPGDLDSLVHRSAHTGSALSVFAMCATGHPIEAEAVARCVGCALDSCPACPPSSHVTPCQLCERPACAGCRSTEGRCPSCANPTREPSLDTAWEHAWRLGGDRTLLVGRRHATVLAGAGAGAEGRVLVPDADLTDPARTGVRALALRLGLPPGAGLRAAPSPDRLDGEAAVWSRIERSVWWDVDASGGEDLEDAVLPELPALRAPHVDGEAGAGLSDLVERLRAADVPPPSPALVARPLTVQRRVVCEDAWLWHEERWQQDAAEPVLAARIPLELGGVDWEATANGRVRVAAGQVAEVRVEVERVHRSYLLRLTDGEHATCAFVPDADGAGFPGESSWAAWVAEQGLAAGTLVTVDHRVPSTPAPRPGVVVRSVRTARVPVDADTGQSARDTDLGAIAGLARGTEPGLPSPQLLPSLREALRRFDASGPVVALATAHLIDERWGSAHGSALRRYAIAAATPLPSAALTDRTFVPIGSGLPPLPDLGEDHDELTVDSRGHLVPRRFAMACPVCHELGCGACGSPGILESCSSCGRLACGGCRGRGESVAAAACGRCAEASCSGCARHLPVTVCTLCRREVCRGCLAGTACLTCDSLAPLDERQRAGLPAELRSLGLQVFGASDPDGDQVVLLRGTYRLELAVVVRGHVGSWTSLRTDDPDSLRARLAFAETAGTGDVAIVLLEGAVPTPPAEPLVATTFSGVEPVWTLRRGETVRSRHGLEPVGEPISATPPGLVDALVAAAGLARPAVPAPAAQPAEALDWLERRGLLAAPLDPPAVLTAAQIVRKGLVAIRPEGLCQWTGEGSQEAERLVEWTVGPAPDHTWAWTVEGWHPEPDVLAHAEGFGVRAAVTRIGGHALVAVHDGEQVRQRLLTDSPLDPGRLLVGQAALGRRALLTVLSVADPDAVVWPTVGGAEFRFRFVGRILTSESHAPELTAADGLAAALEAYAPGEAARWPDAAPVPAGLAPDAFAELFDAAPVDRLIRSVGLEVTDEWTGPGGEPLVARYVVAPGQTHALIPDAVTGELHAEIGWCRERHLTRLLWKCRWCESPTCRQCQDVVKECGVCRLPICGPCRSAAQPNRCQTCGNLSDLGVMEKRRLGLGVLGQSWYSGDGRGHSLVTYRKENWEVVRMLDGRNVSPTMTHAHRLALADLLGVRVRVD
ncbi:MAG: helicase-related protein [Sporichthyaceae bacterium]